MKNTNIIIYKEYLSDYHSKLIYISEKLRKINKIHNEFLFGIWDTKIKYRSSFDRNLNNLQPRYYQERGKWVDFIFAVNHTEHFNTEAKALRIFTAESLYQGKIRLILLLFWRDIVHKLSSDIVFKLQLKINYSGPIESKDKTEAKLKYNKEVAAMVNHPNKNKIYLFNSTDSVYKSTPTVRSIGSVKFFTKNNLSEA